MVVIMLDLKFIRENAEKVITNTHNKNEKADIDTILATDLKRREIIQEVDELKNKRNVVSKEIAMLKKNKEDATEKISSMKEVSERIKALDEEMRHVEEYLKDKLMRVPNMLHESVPVGKSENDNIEIRSWGEKNADIDTDHIEIAKRLGIIDFERGAKVTGSGFAFYVGKGAALERALINFMLDLHINKHGYTEIIPPFVVNRESMNGTGQLPKMEEDMYHATEDDVFLIPTSEVPLTNFHAGDMIKPEELTKKFCAYSPCFRREAGSYGKEVHGFLRVHQFNKVEMVKFTKPEDSWNELEALTNDAEEVLKELGLPYRVLLLCSGDTSFGSAKTYDLEVWTPGEKKWLEVSSCSNFESFQARRANIRFKPDPKSKPEFVHTLNGSGVATSRIMVAILENNLQEDGRVEIPDVLKKYCGFDFI